VSARTDLRVRVVAATAAAAVVIGAFWPRRPPPAPSAVIDAGATMSADAEAGAAAVARAGDPGDDDAGAPRTIDVKAPRNLRIEPPPEVRSARPIEADWNDAQNVQFLTPDEFACKAHIVREWLRVACTGREERPFFTAARSGSLVAGDPAEVSIDADKETSSIVLTFPVRRGDRRVLQIEFQGGGYGGSFDQATPALTISEAWLDGEPAPAIVASPPLI